jgi:hypothetical protein
MLYSLLSCYLPRRLAVVLTAACYACLLLLVILLADSPDGEFRYVRL